MSVEAYPDRVVHPVERYRSRLGLTDAEIVGYLFGGRPRMFHGRALGGAVFLADVRVLAHAVPLPDLRAAMPPGWRVPQGYGFLRGDAGDRMLGVLGVA
jgi:hypothetical protein